VTKAAALAVSEAAGGAPGGACAWDIVTAAGFNKLCLPRHAPHYVSALLLELIGIT